MTTSLMKSNIDQDMGDTNPPSARNFLSEQERLYIEFVMALDAKLLPVSSSQLKTPPHFSKKKL